MSKRGTGAVFCLMASILFAARYIAAAIFMSNITVWSDELFSAGLRYTGSGLIIAAVICLIVGVVYLVKAEIDEKKQN